MTDAKNTINLKNHVAFEEFVGILIILIGIVNSYI